MHPRQIIFFSLLIGVAFLAYSTTSVVWAERSLPFDANIKARDLPASILVETNKGKFEIEFYRSAAPVTVRNFVYLAENKLLENFLFATVRSGFVVQGGDAPDKKILEKLNWTLPAEFSDIQHEKGTVGMRRSPSPINPERRAHPTQFYITLGRAKHLDGLYTVFGKVVSGMEVVESLLPGDKILKIRLPK